MGGRVSRSARGLPGVKRWGKYRAGGGRFSGGLSAQEARTGSGKWG